MLETIPLEVRVSVDIGSHQHRVAIGLSHGEVLEEFDRRTKLRALIISLTALLLTNSSMHVQWRWPWKASMAMPAPWIR